MTEETEEADVSRLCRLCGQLSDAPDDVLDRVDLVETIRERLKIEISENDELPVTVCQKCRTEIISFDKFCCRCTETQITLKNLLRRNGKTLKEDSEEIRRRDASDYLKIKLEEDIKREIESDDDQEDLIPISQISFTPIVLNVRSLKRKLSGESAKCKKRKRKPSVERFTEESENDANAEESSATSSKLRKSLINNSFFKFICHVCNDNFKNWSSLKNHVVETHNEKAKVMCICEKYLYSRHAVHRHIIKHDSSAGIKCKDCDKTFPSEKSVEAHSVVHMPKEEYPHVCSHCAKRFASLLTLKVHEKTHLPKELRYIHTCDVCGVKFPTKSSVKSHISAVHEKFRPYICDVCGHAFNNKGNLLDHRVLHSDEKLHTCPKCPKKFKTRGTLQRHIDCHNDTSYKCSQCPAILNSRRTLRTHMYVHDKFCRYICAFCHKGYKRRKTLKAHMNVHTGERPYSCLWCPKTFADNSNCRIHKRRMHPNELAEYEATHATNQELNKDKTIVKKVIYNMTFKMSENTKPIMLPQLEIKPCLPELMNESQT